MQSAVCYHHSYRCCYSLGKQLLRANVSFPPLAVACETLSHACCRLRWSSSFITTPIFYVNAAPHIGHLYSVLLADAVHRWRRLNGDRTAIFSTGTDEHGLKIQKQAASLSKEPLALCDEISAKFKELFDNAGISYTHYIRTTDPQHSQTVREFWNRLNESGHIYKGKYEGWYCMSDEAFLSDDEITSGPESASKVSRESGHSVEWLSEENYMFRLTSFREQLLEWVKRPPYPVVPEFARHIVIKWLEDENFSDLSISRPHSRLPWGIQVPNDQSQTIYVWLDALLNYLTASDYPLPTHSWPPTEHVIGKDILRFHAILWPAFLLAAGLELPGRIVTHSHWLADNSKMSKSKGNVVQPLEQFSLFGVEQVRYFLLKQGSLQHDGDYSMERLVSTVNSDLPDTLGNLQLRISSKRFHVHGCGVGLRYHRDILPFLGDNPISSARASEDDYALIKNLQELPGVVDDCYREFQINKALEAIMTCLYQTNKFVADWKPWNLVKDSTQHPMLETSLLVVIESLRLCSLLLWPVIPDHASLILHRIGFPLSLETAGKEQLSCKLTKKRVHELEDASSRMQLNVDNSPIFAKVTLAPKRGLQ